VNSVAALRQGGSTGTGRGRLCAAFSYPHLRICSPYVGLGLRVTVHKNFRDLLRPIPSIDRQHILHMCMCGRVRM
jgi:hypothetical protein